MRIHTRILPLVVAVPLLLAAGCAEIDPLEAPPFFAGDADFSTLVALGNSLTMGVQDGGVSESSQRAAFAALFARSVGKTVYSNGANMPKTSGDAILPQTGEFVIPGYGEPGTAGTLFLESLSPPTLGAITNPGVPVNTTYPAPYNNLGVAQANVGDVLRTVTSAEKPLFDLVLRGQGTMLQQAMALDPTFVLLWVGSNDVLKGLTSGDPANITDPTSFEADYRQLIQTLLGESAKPGQSPIVGPPLNPGMVAANVPPVDAIPYVTTVPPFVVDPVTREPVLNPITGGLIPYLGPDGPLQLPSASGPGDLLTLGASPLIVQGYGFAEGTQLPGGITGKGPLPGSVVISVSELAQVRAAVVAVNDIIASVCAEYGVPVVDINALFEEFADHGYEIGGIEYTAEFILGGVFSLDGMHPTSLGQAVVANAFIETANRAYRAAIPHVNYADVLGFQFGVEPVSRPQVLDLLQSEAFLGLADSPAMP